MAQNKTEDKQSEFKVKTIYRAGFEVTVIERKQQPLRIDGFDL